MDTMKYILFFSSTRTSWFQHQASSLSLSLYSLKQKAPFGLFSNFVLFFLKISEGFCGVWGSNVAETDKKIIFKRIYQSPWSWYPSCQQFVRSPSLALLWFWVSWMPLSNFCVINCIQRLRTLYANHLQFGFILISTLFWFSWVKLIPFFVQLVDNFLR